jgi:FixJ family two-component response regulator
MSVDTTAREVVAPDDEVDRAVPAVSRLRVLHVEDNESDATLAQSYIRAVMPDVEFDSVERIYDVTPASVAAASCAILDLSLPDASGLEALRVLRTMSADLPIIVLTGFDDLDVGLSAIRHGAEDYLVKNYVDGDSLQRAMRYAMERRRLTSELAERLAPRTGERSTVGTDTHQVSIDVKVETGIFSLVCQSCGWRADRDLGSISSWGHLERALLPHVAFGGNARPSPSSADAVLSGELVLTATSDAEHVSADPGGEKSPGADKAVAGTPPAA